MDYCFNDFKLMDYLDKFYNVDMMYFDDEEYESECPVCGGWSEDYSNYYATGYKCLSCGYSTLSYLQRDLLSNDYLERVKEKGHSIYVGELYYNSIPDREKYREILKRNLIKLFQEIEKTKVYIRKELERMKESNSSSTTDWKWNSYSLTSLLWPIDIWREYHFWKQENEYGLTAPETIDDALEQLDVLLDILAKRRNIDVFEKMDETKEKESIKSLLSRDINVEMSYFYIFNPETFTKQNIIKKSLKQEEFEQVEKNIPIEEDLIYDADDGVPF